MRKFTFTIQKKVSLMLLSLVLTSISYGATFTAISSGNFSSTTTWAGGVVPSTTVLFDQIIIPSGVTVNMDNNLIINGVTAKLDVEGTLIATENSMLTLNMGTLTGTGTIVLNIVDINAGHTFSFRGSLTAITLNSTASFQSSADIMVSQTLNLTSGTLSLVSGGSLDVSNNGTIVISGGLLSVGKGGSVGLTGNYNVAYTNNSSVEGVELSGSGLKNVIVNVNSNNTLTLTSDLTIVGTLSLTSGTLMLGGNDLTIHGDVSASGSGTVSSTSASNINIISINTTGGTTGTITFSGAPAAVNNLSVNVGPGKQTQIGGSVTVDGTLQLSSGALNFSNASLTIRGHISGFGSLSGNSSSNLTLNTLGGLSTALNFAPEGKSINDLSISVGSGNSVSLASDLTVNGTLALIDGSKFNLNSKALMLGSTSSISGSGSIVANPASDLTINSTGGISSLVISGTIGNMTVNSGGSSSVTLGSNATVGGMLTLQSGSLVLNSKDLTINGNVADSGSGTLASDASSDITIATPSSPSGSLKFSASANTVRNLIVNIGNNGSASIGTDLNVNGTLQFTGGALNIGDKALIMGPSSSITGTGSSSYIITAAGGYVEMHVTADGSSSVNFPVGTSANFAPANIQLNSGSTSGQVQVGVVSDIMEEGTTGVDLSATRSLVDATWHVHSNITSNLDLNLKVMWPAAMEVNGFNHDVAFISHHLDGNWDMSATAAATVEPGGMFSLQKTGLTSLSPFAVFDQNTITAVGEINDDIKFIVFPNPVTDHITIQNTTAFTEPMNMDIYNSTGRLIGNHKLTDATSTISMEGEISGNYFIKFYNNKMSSTKQFTKM